MQLVYLIHVYSVFYLSIREIFIEHCPSGVLSLNVLYTSSVYLAHDDELHWFNELRAHSSLLETCISVQG